mmetsp:Transcript_7177/g.15617  ORF Transcript_7177/g.15617 Transcript_7177/m.15617 type:complete len:404 (-) Transcript_7177:98-1309(-)
MEHKQCNLQCAAAGGDASAIALGPINMAGSVTSEAHEEVEALQGLEGLVTGCSHPEVPRVATGGQGLSLSVEDNSLLPRPQFPRDEVEVASPPIPVEECEGGYAATTLYVGHQLSERFRPSAESISGGVSAPLRAYIVLFLVEVCERLLLEDNVFHAIMSIVDRYVALHEDGTAIEGYEAQRLVLSAFALEMKLRNNYQVHWKVVLKQVIREMTVSVEEVFRMEVKVLSRIQCKVDVPSPVDFINDLMQRLFRPMTPVWENLASYLLDLALADAHVQYGHPHLILAATALGLASRNLNGQAVDQEVRCRIVESILDYWPDENLDSGRLPEQIELCEKDLIRLWVHACQSSSECSKPGDGSMVIKAKFAQPRRHQVSLMQPDQALETLRQAQKPFFVEVSSLRH